MRSDLLKSTQIYSLRLLITNGKNKLLQNISKANRVSNLFDTCEPPLQPTAAVGLRAVIMRKK